MGRGTKEGLTRTTRARDDFAIDTRAVRGHARRVGEVLELGGPRSRWYEDARGRSLKASWHPEAGLVVFSLWESDRCIGTFRLPVADAPDLMVLLAGAVQTWAAELTPNGDVAEA